MKRKYLNLLILFFYMSSVVNADPSSSNPKQKIQPADHYNFVSFVYQISNTFEYFIKHVPLPLSSRQSALAMAVQEKMNKAKMPAMLFKQTDAGLTYNFSSEHVELKYDKKQNKFSVNGKNLNISDKSDFQQIYRAVEKALDNKQASLFHTLFVQEADALGTLGFLAACLAVIVAANLAISAYVKSSINSQVEASMKENKPTSTASVYAMLNMPTEFDCTTDGRLAKQTGDIKSGGAPFLIAHQYEEKMKLIRADSRIKAPEKEKMMATLQREAITQLENKPKTQGFILSYYTSGEIETVKITRPQCEFKFYSPNRPSLVTETEECKKIPLNFSDSGKPLDKDNFLFYLGLDIRTADECCKSNCKDILKAKLPLITAQKQKMESTQSQMIEGLKGAVAE